MILNILLEQKLILVKAEELIICNFVMAEEERERETMTGQNILRCHSVLHPNSISNPIKN